MGRADRPTIVIVENCLGYTGAFKAIFQVTENLKDYYRFVFVLPEGSLVTKSLEEKGFQTYSIPFYPLQKKAKSIFTYFPFLILNAFQLKRILKKEKALIIHANDIYNLAPYLIRLFSAKIKLITHVRILQAAFPSSIYRFWVWLAQRSSDMIVGVSKASLIPFKKREKVRLVYDGISKVEKYEYHYPPESEIYNLLYLSNYTKGKGHELALETFSVVLQKYPNARLIFVGGTFGLEQNEHYKTGLMAMSKDLKIEDKVLFKGFSDDIEKEYKNSHLYLNFSEAESFSFTCLESLYFGAPCIATASGGPQEILKNGEYGVLVERNKNLIAEAIINLLNDPTLRKSLSVHGRAYVRKEFASTSTAEQISDLYAFLLKQ